MLIYTVIYVYIVKTQLQKFETKYDFHLIRLIFNINYKRGLNPPIIQILIQSINKDEFELLTMGKHSY